MGYVPHHAALRLSRARSNNNSTSFDQVGLIFLARPDASHAFVDPICLAMMQGAEYELSKLHASLTFTRISESGDWDKVERLTRSGGVDGWLVYGPPNDEIANRLRTSKLPFVVLGDRRCTQPVHSVNVDNFAVGRLAAEHLASLGHRRIAYMAGSMCFVFQEQIRAGFLATARELHMDHDERLFVNFATLTNDVMHSPVEWLQGFDQMPTAAFMPDFGVALAFHPIFKTSQSAALRETSLLTCSATPPDGIGQGFSRIDLPMSEVGRHGALLLHQLVTESRVERTEVMISPSLIEGGSTRHLKNRGVTANESGSDKNANR